MEKIRSNKRMSQLVVGLAAFATTLGLAMKNNANNDIPVRADAKNYIDGCNLTKAKQQLGRSILEGASFTAYTAINADGSPHKLLLYMPEKQIISESPVVLACNGEPTAYVGIVENLKQDNASGDKYISLAVIPKDQPYMLISGRGESTQYKLATHTLRFDQEERVGLYATSTFQEVASLVKHGKTLVGRAALESYYNRLGYPPDVEYQLPANEATA